jgi:hypothetical protein
MVVEIDGERDQVWEYGDNLFSRFKCKYCVKKFRGGGATRLCGVLKANIIYVYYRLFTYINLVDVILLFFMIFFPFTDFWQKITTPISKKKITDLSVKSAD